VAVRHGDVLPRASRARTPRSGSPMPLGSEPPLTENEVFLIAAWIDAGAPND
jgi:hypothetical protein